MRELRRCRSERNSAGTAGAGSDRCAAEVARLGGEVMVLTEPEVGGDQPGAQGAGLAERLGWHVHDQRLFAQALAHRSWCAEHPGREPNERLEFLGDAVLGLIVTDYLFRSYPDLPEGELAKARAAVVNSVSLASAAESCGLVTPCC